MPADPPYRDDQPTRSIPRTPPPVRRPVGASPAAAPPAPPRRSPAPTSAAGHPRSTTGHPRSTTGHPRSTTVRRRRSRLPLLALLLVAVLVGYPVLLGITAWSNVDHVDALPSSGSPADTPGTTFLVVGSDSRAGLDEQERAELSTGDDEGQRTDTIMLLHVPDSGGPAALVSIPRDSYVPIPGHGRNKINAAFSLGGPTLLVQTLEEVSGLHVDHYVETGFGGFAQVVDAVGGVRMCVDQPVQDVRAGLDLQAGCQEMDGATALGFARYRYSDPLGDLGRVQRQRDLLSAIMAKSASPLTLVNPFRALPLASAGGEALTLDEGASPLALATFGTGMRQASGADGISMTVPISDPELRTAAGTAVKWDTERALQMFAALRADDTGALRSLAG